MSTVTRLPVPMTAQEIIDIMPDHIEALFVLYFHPETGQLMVGHAGIKTDTQAALMKHYATEYLGMLTEEL